MAGAVATERALPLQWPLVARHEEVELFTATLADERAHGFVIHGASGVGKTRLADQCLAVAGRAGRFVARATATEGARAVPLGALAHLLPPGLADERGDLVAVVSVLRPVLQAQGTNGPLVLFVDDLPLLDATSATLVSQLVDADLVFLLATVRDGAGVPAGLDSLWQRARVRRVDLGDLERAAVDTLLHLVLRGPVESNTVVQIFEASRGNVLFVRELVLGALDSGNFVHQHGVWRLAGPLVTTARLNELIVARLRAVPADATEALDILAVWEPAGLAMLEAVVGRGPLEALDHAKLLGLTGDGRRQPVRLAHPLYGEILRARMPVLTRRRLLLEHADRIESYGSRRREDPVRVATARLEATGTADPGLLVQAARLARYGHDLAQVERLGRAAALHGMTAEVGLLIGEALHELGSWAEADDVLTRAEAAATGDDLLAPIVEMRAKNLMWGLLRSDDALEVNRAARDRLGDGPSADELDLSEALLLTYSGQPTNALATLDALAEPTRPRARALRALAAMPALAAIGRSVTAAAAAKRAFAEQTELPDQVAIARPGVHVLTRIQALADAGRIAHATALAASAYAATPADAPPAALMWLARHLGRCHLAAGQPATARRWLVEALARSDERQYIGARCLVLSGLATTHALLGEREQAAAAIVDLDGMPLVPFVRAEQEQGRAWSLVAAGDLPGARQVLWVAADLAATTGYRATEAALLHDVARLGDAASVVARLQELADVCEGELVAAYAAHAAATAGRGAEALVAVSNEFERIGAVLLAAEAATEAAEAFRRNGERRGAAALEVRAGALAGRCEGARTPALNTPAVVVPLTRRERDIATLAAGGDSSQAIADRLFLSVRTVNNHLQSVYSKLGITGRHELPAALADVSGLPSEQ